MSLDDLLKALQDTLGDASPYLLGFPAGNNGLRSTDTNSPRKVALADRIDKECHFFFGNQGSRDFFVGPNRYASGKSEPRAVICGSDAHSLDDLERLGGDIASFPSTWIKADATFTGLRQIYHEPDNRVFIASEPEVISRQSEDSARFLSHLHIDQVEGYDERNGRWFKDV